MINWKVRYSKIISRNRELLEHKNSVLEVGCGQYGIAYYLKRSVTGIELNPVHSLCEWLIIQQGSVLDLPFADGAFDYVICVDVLEHLQPKDRPRAFAELLRVAGRRLILSCPIQEFGSVGETSLATWFEARHGAHPDWLKEHLINGLPSIDVLLELLVACGYCFDLYGNEGMIQHYAGILIDHELPLMQQLLALHDHKTVFESPLASGEWDLYYSYAFEVDKTKPINVTNNRPIQHHEVISNEKTAIYVACHQHELIEDFGKLKPLLTGPAAVNAPSGIVTDFLHDGTRLLNSRWSELSGIYKLWREGPCTDIVGFTHYRRFFDFSGEDVQGFQRTISKQELRTRLSQLFDASLIASCNDLTVIVPRPFEIGANPWHQYSYAHSGDDLCRVVSLLSLHAPELLPYVRNWTHNTSFYAWNMFVMNWALFDRLCSTWFGLLLEFERQVSGNRASHYQNRDISFLAERLFDIWIRYAKDQYGLKLVEVPIFFVE